MNSHQLDKLGVPDDCVKSAIVAIQAATKSGGLKGKPLLVEGQLSRTARRGKAIFDDPQVGCARCHAGGLLTDSQAHDVGTHVADDWQDENRFLTPKLIELWRTAPYLHHGKPATLQDVLTKYNLGDRHGRTSHLDESEIQALVEYLESL